MQEKFLTDEAVEAEGVTMDYLDGLGGEETAWND